MGQHILIADDDAQIRDVLRIALTQVGFETSEVSDGRSALRNALQHRPDLVVLDIGMPEMDGLEVCRRLRQDTQVPILFLTAQGDEIDRVVGLELGADDYVTKPFSPREVIARIRAILKRAGAELEEPKILKRGILTIDPDRHRCSVNGTPVSLTAREMELVAQLMKRPEHVMSRPQLVDAIYGTNVHVSDRTMDSHLRNVRAKLNEAGCPDAIDTVHGVGVRMGPCKGR